MIDSLYKTFQHWSESGSVWIISDLHLNDEDCILMNPNWIEPEKQIEIINNKVFKNDRLILLGDHGDSSYLAKIKCKHIISIYGNHDRHGDYKGLFEEEYSGALFIADKILLSHEAIYGLPFCVNIHGHHHNGEYRYYDEYGCKHINLAADVCNYEPINLGKEIKNGLLSDIPQIHRITIDSATERKNNGKF